MVKIVSKILIIFILLVVQTFASSDIAKYEKSLYSGSKEESYRAFNNIKMIYLNAIVEDDKRLQRDSLTAMIKALRSFGKDSSQYEKELTNLNKILGEKDNLKEIKKELPKKIEKVKHKEFAITSVDIKDTDISLIINQNFSKDKVKYSSWYNGKKYHDIYDIEAKIPKDLVKKAREPFKLGQHEHGITRVVVTSVKKPKTYLIVSNNRVNIKILNKEPLEKKREIKQTKTIPSINKVVKSNGKLLLYFSSPISEDHVKFFEWNKNGYNDIYEIDAKLMAYANKSYKFDGVRSVKVVTYSPKKTRVVINNRKKIDTSMQISKNRLYISIISKTNTKTTPSPTVSKSTKNIVQYRKNKVVVIDPGHGGKDSGAIGQKKYREKKIVYAIAKKVEKELKRKGYTVKLTRTRDKYIALQNRTKYANKVNADIFISIHANAVALRKANSVHGIETYFLSPSKEGKAKRVAAKENEIDIQAMNYFSKMTFLDVLNQSKMIASNKLAIDVHRNMMISLKHKYKVRDGGVRKGPFWVLVGAQMPSVLVEVGYITHPTESKRLVSSSYQNRLATGIANGIDSYFRKNP
jgi:N-acetylmuramoyl-L-alanine amidase